MTFLTESFAESLTLDGRAAFDRQFREWSVLRDAVVPFIGERAVSLFSYAISDENKCLVCSVFFRKVLVDNGEDPDNPSVTEAEQLLIEWGRYLASSPAEIPAEFAVVLDKTFTAHLRVLLVALAAQMIAATVLVTACVVPLDEGLYDYRRPGDNRTGG